MFIAAGNACTGRKKKKTQKSGGIPGPHERILVYVRPTQNLKLQKFYGYTAVALYNIQRFWPLQVTVYGPEKKDRAKIQPNRSLFAGI